MNLAMESILIYIPKQIIPLIVTPNLNTGNLYFRNWNLYIKLAFLYLFFV
jgi:hypothetical protein